MKRIDENESAFQEAKRQSLEDMKKTLEEQAIKPRNNALHMDGPLNLNACGPSSVQCLQGEDPNHEERKKIQQEQVQYWCAENVLEKKKAFEEEQRREREYVEHVREQDRIRSELEKAATKKKEEEAKLLQHENMEYARLARERKEQEKEAEKLAQAQQTHYLQTCALLSEDTKLAMNVNAHHRFRPDHFKGYDRDTVKQIYQENDAVVEEKQVIGNSKANDERDWEQFHAGMVHEMDRAEKQRRQRVEEENRNVREILDQQKELLQERKKEIESSKLPAIGTEFFQRFGQSCR